MILACDPGMSGGFCFVTLSEKTFTVKDVHFEKFPVIGKEIDFSGLYKIFNIVRGRDDVQAIVEKVSAMPGQGVSSMFKFGRAYGIAQAFICAEGIPLIEVTPRAWQKEVFEGMPEQTKTNGKRDTKKMSLVAASRLFPELHLKKDWQSDSLLIAEYYRRKLFGQLLRNIKTPTNKDLSAGA